MPYGYPVRVYRPHHTVRLPRASRFRRHSGGMMSNKVPWIHALDLVDQQVLGIYNRQIVKQAA